MAKSENNTADLDWTGERLVPGIEGEIAAEHLHRYAIAREIVQGKDVLDIACGEGYGSNLLSRVARSVIGVDLAEDVVRHARSRYIQPGLQFEVGSCTDIPLRDNSVDVIVSFETIEHHSQHEEMLVELKRVLRPDGVLIISSPDKHEYSEVPGSVNPFHVKELYLDEFQSLLKNQFQHIDMYGQRVNYGSVITPMESGKVASWYTFAGGFDNIRSTSGVEGPMYFIAVATDGPPVTLPVGIFSDPESILRKERQITALERNGMLLSDAIAERDRQLAGQRSQAVKLAVSLKKAQDGMNSSQAEIVSLNQSTADLSTHVDSLNQAIIERDGQLRSLHADLAVTKSKIAAMASSRSWRFTRLFRKFGHKESTNRSFGAPNSDQMSGNPFELSSADKAARLLALSERGIAATGRERFDAEFYLRLYPDVRENYVGDPYEHFVAHGKSEGRLGFLPSLEYSGDFNRLNPDRDTVLVVSHEASTTGAPVLSLNIIWELKTKYNVIVLLLNGGSLLSDLQTSADIVVGPLGRHADTLLRYQMDDLLARCRILFALVNSVESRIVLPELARNFVPSVALIHEFASNTRPRNAIEEAIFWASETIFSADIVRDNAVSAFPDLSRRLPAVIPQGRCSRVLTSPDELSSMRDVERIRQTFRPAGWPEDTPVVLGVGSVHIRKGVDLFVACAARVAQSLRCRFVWIGSGYDPDIDKEYSAYLEDQIERAGLTDRFAFMRETSRIDFAYENSDILVVSSRLDPLPNVSIDAVSRGLPIVCFDKATGIADILRKNGLGKECVASYLDVESLALCVIAFLENPELRRSVGSRLKDIAEQTFNMTTYVAQIEKIALGGVYRAGQECLDYATIAENPDLDLDYLMGPRAAKFGKDESIRRFIRSWENGFLMRKPYSGFHPGIYMERCGIANLESNPFAHYLRAGSPEGPWSYEVLGPLIENSKVHTLPNLSVALHLHIFYPDLAPAIIDRLNANGVRPDLFVSVSSEMARNEIEILFRAYEGKTIDIQVVPNRGRDIGAFLTVFGDRITSQYEIVGHFHTKKTEELGNDAMGKAWFNFLLENLIGGRHNMVDTILGAMASNPSIGLVFPDEPHVVGWTDNRESAKCLAEKMGLPIPQVEYFNFPVGTMFWARSSAILPLIALKLDWNDYPAEPLASDGTVLHAIERLLPFLSDAAGLRSLLTSVPGVTR